MFMGMLTYQVWLDAMRMITSFKPVAFSVLVVMQLPQHLLLRQDGLTTFSTSFL